MSKKTWSAAGAVATVLFSAGTGIATNVLTDHFSWAVTTTVVVLVAGGAVTAALMAIPGGDDAPHRPAKHAPSPSSFHGGGYQPAYPSESGRPSQFAYVSGGRSTVAGRDVRTGMPPMYLLAALLIVAAVAISALVIVVQLDGSDPAAAATDAPLTTNLVERGTDQGCPMDTYYFPGDITDLRSSLTKPMISKEGGTDPQALAQWVARENGWRQTNYLEFTIQSNSPSAIILTALTVNVISDTPLRSQTKVFDGDGCGSATVPRTFEINFNDRPPRVRAIAGQDDDGRTVPAVRFPFKVSATDPEIFDLTVATGPAADVQWTATLAYTQNGQSRKAVIDDGGKPFHSVPKDDLPMHQLLDGALGP